MNESMQDRTLLEKYPWLERTNSVEEYLPPEYYKDLLQPYVFCGAADLQLLENFLQDKKASKVLELGCGSGRASDIVTRVIPHATYTFSDLSVRMLTSAKSHLPQQASFVVSDAVEFMEDTTNTYDLVYTLWSFSHSIHQHFHRLGIQKAEVYIASTLTKFVKKNIAKNGSFYLIHFDSLSEEQRILMRQWKRVFPIFAAIEHQSPSKQIIDKALLALDNQGIIRLSIQHLKGETITYKSEDELLETFMNFHLETYFNTSSLVKEVLEDIKTQAAPYRQNDGSYSITPGCYVYSFIKN